MRGNLLIKIFTLVCTYRMRVTPDSIRIGRGSQISQWSSYFLRAPPYFIFASPHLLLAPSHLLVLISWSSCHCRYLLLAPPGPSCPFLLPPWFPCCCSSGFPHPRYPRCPSSSVRGRSTVRCKGHYVPGAFGVYREYLLSTSMRLSP